MLSDSPPGPPLRRRLRDLPTLVVSIVLAGILLCVVTISFLASVVYREVDSLAVANSDTTQWSLIQTEVELLSLQLVAEQAAQAADPDLDGLRLRYDILYSRIRSIEEGRQFETLRQDAGAASSLAAMRGFLDRYTPAIDGPDATLIAGLPDFARDLSALRRTVRDFSLLSVRFFAAQSDERRENVAGTLASIGMLTFALVMAVLGGIAILLAMYRRSIRSERLAADTRNRLEEVIGTSLDGIIATDDQGLVIEFNRASERIFGYARDEAIGHDMAELIIPPQLRAAHRAGMKRYRTTRQRHVVGKGLVRLEASRKDGSVFPVELSISSGEFRGREIFVSFLRDISDRVAAEQELITARDSAVAGEKAKADLLAVMSHEMRTPLNGIMGTIELMEGTGLDPRQSRFIAAMKTSAGLLLNHVNGVLSMSRAEAGELDLKPASVDPDALLQELVESQRPAIEAHGNRIECDTSGAPPRLWVDPLRLRQIILNLVGNANKFTRNGEIRVECDRIAGMPQVEFRVIDTGIGIEEKDLGRIFEEFHTLDTSYARNAEGTGLGLAIARRLVQAMGGEIGVDSEPGEGSLFWVRLPMGLDSDLREAQRVASTASTASTASAANATATAAATGAGTAPPAAPAPDDRRLKILLVEDNQINRLVAREMLQGAGHLVFEAHDGREGVRAAAEQVFDVILMDISMPEMDGVAASRQIRADGGPNRATPIIALTAHALPEDTERFLQAGISQTLVKPMSLAHLNAALTQALNGGAPGGAETSGQPGIALLYRRLADRIGAEKSARLMQEFRAEGDSLFAATTAAEWQATPPDQRADQVHRLAGSAAVLGAAELRLLLQEAETALRSDLPERSDRPLARLGRVWARTRTEIDRCLAP